MKLSLLVPLIFATSVSAVLFRANKAALEADESTRRYEEELSTVLVNIAGRAKLDVLPGDLSGMLQMLKANLVDAISTGRDSSLLTRLGSDLTRVFTVINDASKKTQSVLNNAWKRHSSGCSTTLRNALNPVNQIRNGLKYQSEAIRTCYAGLVDSSLLEDTKDNSAKLLLEVDDLREAKDAKCSTNSGDSDCELATRAFEERSSKFALTQAVLNGDCDDLQKEMDEQACDQASTRSKLCLDYMSCTREGNSVDDWPVIQKKICGEGGTVSNYQKAWKMVSQIQCIASSLSPASASCLTKDYDTSMFLYEQCSNSETVDRQFASDCAILKDVDTDSDTAGNLAYSKKYYTWPAPKACTASCCTKSTGIPEVGSLLKQPNTGSRYILWPPTPSNSQGLSAPFPTGQAYSAFSTALAGPTQAVVLPLLTTTITTTTVQNCLNSNLAWQSLFSNAVCGQGSTVVFDTAGFDSPSNLTQCQSRCSQDPTCQIVVWQNVPGYYTRCRGFSVCNNVVPLSSSNNGFVQMYANCPLIRTGFTTTTTTTSTNTQTTTTTTTSTKTITTTTTTTTITSTITTSTSTTIPKTFGSGCVSPTISFDLFNVNGSNFTCGSSDWQLFDVSSLDSPDSLKNCQNVCLQNPICSAVLWTDMPGIYSRCRGFSTCLSLTQIPNATGVNKLYAMCSFYSSTTTTTPPAPLGLSCNSSNVNFLPYSMPATCGVGSVQIFQDVQFQAFSTLPLCQALCSQTPGCIAVSFTNSPNAFTRCQGYSYCPSMSPALTLAGTTVQTFANCKNFVPVVPDAFGGNCQATDSSFNFIANSTDCPASNLIFENVRVYNLLAVNDCQALCSQVANCIFVKYDYAPGSYSRCRGYSSCPTRALSTTALGVTSMLMESCANVATSQGSTNSASPSSSQVAQPVRGGPALVPANSGAGADPSCPSGIAQVKLSVALSGKCVYDTTAQAFRWFQNLGVASSTVTNPANAFSFLKSKRGCPDSQANPLVPHIVVWQGNFQFYLEGTPGLGATQAACDDQKNLISQNYPVGQVLVMKRCLDELVV
jgi:hypothetical protein